MSRLLVPAEVARHWLVDRIAHDAMDVGVAVKADVKLQVVHQLSSSQSSSVGTIEMTPLGDDEG